MVLSFDLLYQGKLCGIAWAEMSENPSSQEILITCFQKYYDLKEIGLQKMRSQSVYTFDAAGKPTSVRLQVEGQKEQVIKIAPTMMNYGKEDIPLEAPLDFATESNLAPLLILWWEKFQSMKAGSFNTLAPGSGAVFDFTLTEEGTGFRDNFGQSYHRNENGKISKITKESSDFEFILSNRKAPNWRLGSQQRTRTYRPPADLNITDVVLKTEGTEREATVARPLNAAPKAVGVFIGGTGIYGRHGQTSQMDIGYHQLLDGLARQGIASVRYEKFDQHVSNAVEAEGAMDFETLCSDAERWLNWLADQDWAQNLPKLLIGHSMGGMIALSLENNRSDIAACVLLSTPGRPLEDIIQQQINWQQDHAIFSEKAKEEGELMRKALLDALKIDAEWTAENVDPKLLTVKHKKRFFKSAIFLNPCHFMEDGESPVLILQGTKDVQVFMEDAENLYEAAQKSARNTALIKAEGLDHLLKRNNREGLDALSAYKDHRRRVPVAVIRKLEQEISRLIGLKTGLPKEF